jgi:hypothetical protein
LWFQTGGALNFITAAPHCGEKKRKKRIKNWVKEKKVKTYKCIFSC